MTALSPAVRDASDARVIIGGGGPVGMGLAIEFGQRNICCIVSAMSIRNRSPRAARAGHHFAPHPLSSGRNVFEELGDGFTLLSLDADSGESDACETAARTAGIPLKVVRDDSGAGHKQYAAAHVLVRPDQFVAWASAEIPIDPQDVLRTAVGVG